MSFSLLASFSLLFLRFLFRLFMFHLYHHLSISPIRLLLLRFPLFSLPSFPSIIFSLFTPSFHTLLRLNLSSPSILSSLFSPLTAIHSLSSHHSLPIYILSLLSLRFSVSSPPLPFIYSASLFAFPFSLFRLFRFSFRFLFFIRSCPSLYFPQFIRSLLSLIPVSLISLRFPSLFASSLLSNIPQSIPSSPLSLPSISFPPIHYVLPIPISFH